ncbi:hypothetical protein, partial [Amycolatopsis sp. NPDC051716]|uniref:hypothetical protein n=1 Tax=Amycolatopsis sp. NPDC051716 TaxID=3155804 RepID=UPI00343547D2
MQAGEIPSTVHRAGHGQTITAPVEQEAAAAHRGDLSPTRTEPTHRLQIGETTSTAHHTGHSQAITGPVEQNTPTTHRSDM